MSKNWQQNEHLAASYSSWGTVGFSEAAQDLLLDIPLPVFLFYSPVPYWCQGTSLKT